ncbi:MAG TPA: thioesterase family protein [Usitatibacter sp.]|nr:thioesterase family protein [Usitatibacter sp.]
MATQATPYSELMSQVEVRPGESRVVVPDDWLQGRTLFGGLQAAIALKAMRTLAPQAPLRSMQVTFVGPVPGGPVQARARVLRSGKNTTHVEARIVDGEETLATMVGVFGLARASSVNVLPAQPAVPAGKPIEMRYVQAAVPAFTQHFKARWLHGGPPFTGATERDNVIELGMRDPARASEYHVLAMADFIPPIALSFLTERAAAASLNWMLELLVDDVGALPLEGWRLDAHMVAAGEGYTHQSLELWGPGGLPVALGRQTMVVFA